MPSVSPHFVSFVWRYHFCLRPYSLLPPGSGRFPQRARVCWAGSPLHGFSKAWRRQDLPGSWMTLFSHLPRSWTPVGPTCQAVTTRRCCPRSCDCEDPNKYQLSRLNHAASAIAAYASRSRSPQTMQGSLPAAGRLYQMGLAPTGSFRKVSGFYVIRPPSPGLAWRDTGIDNISKRLPPVL